MTMERQETSQAGNKETVYIDHIDGLRAMAVILVFLLHLNVPYVTGGFVGVDIFFVISGYLITRLIVLEIETTGSFSFVKFYFRRTKRILPALIFTLALCVVIAALLFAMDHFRRFGAVLAAASLSVSNVYYWSESGYFDSSKVIKPLLNTWSLGVEEQFYMFWPLFIVIFLKGFSQKFLSLFFAALFFISLALNLWFQTSQPEALYYLMPFRIYEFSVGALMVEWKKLNILKLRSKIFPEIFCATGIAMMLIPSAKFDKDTIFPSLNALFPCIGAALIIHCGDAPISGFIFHNTVSRHLGKISYSMYLMHWPIIIFYAYFKGSELVCIEKVAIFSCTCIIASLMYVCIEQPFRNRHPKSSQPLNYICYYALVMLGIALLGGCIYYQNGWPWRLPKTAQLAINKIEEKDPDYWRYLSGGRGSPEWTGWTYKLETDSSPRIVLLGDSFSQALEWGLKEVIGKPENISIYLIRTQCLPLPDSFGANQIDEIQSKTACTEELQRAIDLLLKRPDSILVLYVSWPARIQQRIRLSTGFSLAVHGAYRHGSVNFSNVTEDFDKLRDVIGKRRWVLVGSTLSQYDGGGIKNVEKAMREARLTCSFRPFLGRTNCIQSTTTKWSSMSTFKRQINDMLQKYALQHENTFFVNPYDSFCSNNVCNFFNDDGLPYFFDPYHVSTTGSYKVVADHKKVFFGSTWPQNGQNVSL